MPDKIDKLTAAVASGDHRAVEVFYRRYFDLLLRHAARVTGRDEAFCLDIVQEAILRVLRTIRKVESEAQLAAWLRLVVRTTAYDLLRAEQRRRRREVTTGPRAPSQTELIDEEMLESLRCELNRVDPEIAVMIELRYRRDWTLARIAESFGLTVGTVDGRLRRAICQLRSRLEEVPNESVL